MLTSCSNQNPTLFGFARSVFDYAALATQRLLGTEIGQASLVPIQEQPEPLSAGKRHFPRGEGLFKHCSFSEVGTESFLLLQALFFSGTYLHPFFLLVV